MDSFGQDNIPSPDAIWMKTPCFCCLNMLLTPYIVCVAPSTCNLIISSTSFGLKLTKSSGCLCAMPALLTKHPIYFPLICCNSLSTPSLEAKSAWIAFTFVLSFSSWDLVSYNSFSRTSTIVTSNFLFAKNIANSLPIPDEAPVTTTCFALMLFRFFDSRDIA